MIPGVANVRRQEVVRAAVRAQPADVIRTQFGYEGPVEIVDHHLSHAASAFFYSGFRGSGDPDPRRRGDWPTTTYGSGGAAGVERFDQVDFPHSLGFFDSAITSYLGFEVNEGEYKVRAGALRGAPVCRPHPRADRRVRRRSVPPRPGTSGS